ncbi:MAG: 2-oxo acid dehydrogenase subunit E2 [Candidatus Rokubacteria bacterium]|nr:2-oxo acid dehydrogenase subunit E2 [Candidatus Rokubacteria bacterium]
MAVSKVVMPKLSEQMETGKLIKWIKKEGDRVQAGDIVAEVETDKADVEMEAFGAGVLRKILVQPGDRVPVGALIAVIAEPNDDIASVVAEAGGAAQAPAPAATTEPAPSRPAAAPPSKPAAAPAAAPKLPQRGDELVTREAPKPAATGTPATAPSGAAHPAAAAAPAGPAGGRVKASPLAKKIASQSGVDLRLIRGSGPGGRIIRKDVEAAATAGPSGTVAPAYAPSATGPEYEDVALSSMRATIAKRMPLSKGPVPHFYVTSDVAMDRAWELRESLNGLAGQPKISVNDLVIRACALTLLRHPGVNASFQGESIRVHHRVHMGIAVALEEGLITPVLRDVHAKSLAQIATEARDLAERARHRKLRANELSGATFSISNLGMFDVSEFSAIINPPEGAILAVGSVKVQPVVTDTGLGVGRRMKLTISCDHRVMDGAMGARFLQDVGRLLEEPLRLLV